MWRLTGDFWDRWEPLHAMFDKCEEWQGVTQKGNYPDCDMLPIGKLSKNGTCHGPQNRWTQFTKPEQYTLMTLWGIFRSPLMIGGNMPEFDGFTTSLLTNAEYMKMHQTSYGAKKIMRREKNGRGAIAWAANGKGCKYIALFNTDNKVKTVTLNVTDILMPDAEYRIFDIWANQAAGKIKNTLGAEIEPHGAKLFKVTV